MGLTHTKQTLYHWVISPAAALVPPHTHTNLRSHILSALEFHFSIKSKLKKFHGRLKRRTNNLKTIQEGQQGSSVHTGLDTEPES